MATLSNQDSDGGSLYVDGANNGVDQAKPEHDRCSTIRVYRYRWFILFLYSILMFSCIFVQMSLFSVSDATVVYYRITFGQLIWSSNASTILQLIVAIPFTFLPSRLGLRSTMIIGAVLNAIGACAMIAATSRDGFAYVVVGLVVISLSFSVIPQLAPEVSATWFGRKEHALSTSIGIIIGNLGGGVAFVLPSMLIDNIDPNTNIDYIGKRIREIIYSQAALSVFVLVLIIVFFKKNPPTPPTHAQSLRKNQSAITLSSFRTSYKCLLKNKNYLQVGNALALSNLLANVVPMILNPVVSWRFPSSDVIIGWMGFSGILGGILGSVIFSVIIDRTKSYKKVLLSLGLANIFLWIGFTETLVYWNSLTTVFILLVLCFLTGLAYSNVMVDLISEMTYPIPESMSYVLTIAAGRIYSIPVVFGIGYLEDQKHMHAVCWVVAGLIITSYALVIFPKVQRKRTEAGNEGGTMAGDDVAGSRDSLLPVGTDGYHGRNA